MAAEPRGNELYDTESESWKQFSLDCVALDLDIFDSWRVGPSDRENIRDRALSQADLDSHRTVNYNKVAALCRSMLQSTDLSFSMNNEVGGLQDLYLKLHRNDEKMYRQVRKAKLLTHEITDGNMRLMPTCKTIRSCMTRLQKHIVEIIKNPSRTLLQTWRSMDVDEAQQFAIMVELRRELRVKLNKRLVEVKSKVDHHNALRHAKVGVVLSDDFIGADLLGQIFSFCTFGEAVQLMRVNKEFLKNESLKELLPRLSIRHFPEVFPHAAIGGNEYILSHKKVSVYVDFVICGSRNSSTASTSFQSTKPKVLCNRTAQAIDAKKVKARYSPEEIVDEDRFRERVPHENFFSTPIVCKIDLVSAETHECAGSFSVVSPHGAPPRRGVPGAAGETYTCLLGNSHPAKCEGFVQSTSQRYGLGKKQRFCIRVQGSALRWRSRPSEDPYHQLLAFSRPFEVVSKLSVAKNARRRESKERDREQKKQKLDKQKR